ncbi:MAG: DUF1573 domain-containing protein [Muribaculaceae bacterium]|nr:DUF1573 domain-containing protein [Muribaculaceae bacterium]
MKRILFIAFAIFCFAFQAIADDYAQATYPIKEHDFGYIKEDGGLVSCEFEFVNTGNKPLIVIEAVASCGCTRPEYPKRPIEPGKKGKIKVTYNPNGRPGAFKKDIKVRTNGKEKRTTLYIIGSATPKKSSK